MNEPNTGTRINDGMRENSKLRDARDNIAEAVQDKFQDLKGRAAETYERGKEKLHEWEDSLVQTVRSAPMKSVLIAAGVGLALGFLFRRS